jgi:acylphosphatase
MEAEGDEDALEKFMEWCRHGPPRALVHSINCVEKEVEGFTFFEVRR